MFPLSTKILVVDDMKTMRLVVKKTLTGIGFTDIAEAENGDTAWQALEQALSAQHPFALIISDWTMPVMSGLDLLKKVRAHKSMGKLPFLMVTAESDADQIKAAITAGVSNYITKPFTPDVLKAKLTTLAEKKAS